MLQRGFRPTALFMLPLLCVLAHPWAARAQASADPRFGASAISERGGTPLFTLHGKPFFIYGAAFFYERLPRESWRGAMFALKYRLHINTLDLYVPWNWHELGDGTFDFDGRTNPRRDLREVIRLARRFGFALIVRPGPVIRNEWRNGGYPAWLLRRPEYGMPRRDLLEGRYPPTATLQNAHSDDAAAAWLHNATHRRYAARWLERALREFAPVADRVVAIALDDDQGAYIDNQTWPAPHLRQYLAWLRARVARATRGRVPVFINTYQMKVTASAPVWAMGNWYQSDAYAIGEHDRAQLEFSTGLLQSRPHQPLMASEFQAGWLQQPEDVLPQAAAASNTLLALTTLIAMGARGIVNFPAQDTMYPAGYEVPFANAFYAWDAALGYGGATSQPDLRESPRARPTRLVGAEIATFNSLLAAARIEADAAIVSLPSAYDASQLTNADVATLAQGTMTAQRFCRQSRLTCEIVDLRYESLARLRTFPLLIVPLPEHGPLRGRAFVRAARVALAAYRHARRTAVLANARPSAAALGQALGRAQHARYVEGADATLAQDPATGAGFLALVDYDGVPHDYAHPVVRTESGERYDLPALRVPARTGLLLPLDIPLQPYNVHFARDDRFSATCAVTGILSPPAVARDRIALDFDRAAKTCSIDVRIARHRYTAVLPPAQTRAEIDARGALIVRSATPARSQVAMSAPSAALRFDPRTLPIRSDLHIAQALPASVAPGAAVAYAADVYHDGEGAVVLENDLVRIVAVPRAGGRAFVFEDKAHVTNVFTTVGALRDDVLVAPPESTVDRIAKFTNHMPAGFFNRAYRAHIESSGTLAAVRWQYDAPDAYPSGAHFDRRIALRPHARCFAADLTNRFDGSSELAARQRAVSVTSLAVGNLRAPRALVVLDRPYALASAATRSLPQSQHSLALFDPATHELALVAWSASREPVTLSGHTNSLLLRIAQAPRVTSRLSFAYEFAPNLQRAMARTSAFAISGCGDAQSRPGDAKGSFPRTRSTR